MGTRREARRGVAPGVEACEPRVLLTLVFVFNGDDFKAAKPNALTASAARVLQRAGNQVVQLANPTLNSPAAIEGVAERILSISHGRPIGLVGFSAGGNLALHLAAVPALNVVDVFDNYGAPDVSDFIALHGRDRFGRALASDAHLSAAAVSLLSGPIITNAHVVAAFGLRDANIIAGPSAASLARDAPGSDIDFYPGGHGAAITASPAALDDFLAHL